MKTLIALGLTLASLTLSAAAFAGGGGGTLGDRRVQELFQWSGQAVQTVRPETQTAGPAAQTRPEIPLFMEHRGSSIR